MADAAFTPSIAANSRLKGASAIWRDADPIQRAAMVLALILIAAAILAPFIAPFGPEQQSLIARLRPPIGFERYKDGYLLGTDELGRDVLSRTLYGLRLTLTLALLGASIGLVAGGLLAFWPA